MGCHQVQYIGPGNCQYHVEVYLKYLTQILSELRNWDHDIGICLRPLQYTPEAANTA